jgi:hypothetical protein
MPYVFDTSSFRVLQNYFPSSFPTFWANWQIEVTNGDIISVREVKRELDVQAVQEHLIDWCNGNSHIFLSPTDEESELVVRIFAIPKLPSTNFGTESAFGEACCRLIRHSVCRC